MLGQIPASFIFCNLILYSFEAEAMNASMKPPLLDNLVM